MEDVVDLAAVLRHPLGVDAEALGGEVTDHRDDPVGLPELDHLLHAGERALAHEHVDRAVAVVEQFLDQMTPDEPGGAGDEVRHAWTLLGSRAVVPAVRVLRRPLAQRPPTERGRSLGGQHSTPTVPATFTGRWSVGRTPPPESTRAFQSEERQHATQDPDGSRRRCSSLHRDRGGGRLARQRDAGQRQPVLHLRRCTATRRTARPRPTPPRPTRPRRSSTRSTPTRTSAPWCTSATSTRASSSAREAYDRQIAGLWSRFADPLVYTPGDNEWTDCHKKAEGGGVYNPATGQVDYVIDAPRATRSTTRRRPGRQPRPGPLDLLPAARARRSAAAHCTTLSQATVVRPGAPRPTQQYVENVIWQRKGVAVRHPRTSRAARTTTPTPGTAPRRRRRRSSRRRRSVRRPTCAGSTGVRLAHAPSARRASW